MLIPISTQKGTKECSARVGPAHEPDELLGQYPGSVPGWGWGSALLGTQGLSVPILWQERGEKRHEKPLKPLPLEEMTAFLHPIPPQGGFSADNIVSFSSSEFITVLQITLPSHSAEMTYRSENNYLIPLGAILTG